MARIDPVTFVDPRGRSITVRNCNAISADGASMSNAASSRKACGGRLP
jgi:hypothetical protein